MAKSQSLFSVRQLIFGAVTLVTVIPLVVFWLWPFSRALNDDLDYAARAHLLIARNLGATLDRYHAVVVTAFDLLSANIESGNTILAADPMLRTLHLRHVCLADAETGTVIAGIYQGGQTCPPVISADRLANFRAMAETPGVSIGPVSAGPDGRPVLYLVRPLGGRLAIGALETGYFVALAGKIAFGERGHAVILDRTGHVLAHPLAEWQTERRDLSALPVVQQMLAGRTGVGEFFSPAMQADMIAGYTVAPESGWGVMVPQPTAELAREASGIQGSVLGVLALGLAIALLAGWILSGLLAKPLGQLMAITRSVDAAQPSARLAQLTWYAPLELRALAASFNGMLARISEATASAMQSQKKAERGNMAKTEFMANMSHELRTPLNAIVGFSDALEHGVFGHVEDPRHREYIHYIHSSALHLRDLIEDIMDVSRIEAGMVETHDCAFDLAEAVEAAMNLVRADAQAKGIALAVRPVSPALVLVGDSRQFSQIMINLLGNAIKFTPGPNGRVSLTTAFDGAGDLLLMIADTGVGIPPDQIGDILQPFKRGEGSYVRNQPGSGLGLSIVSKLIERHGGRLTLESTVGVGTRAIIRWPKSRLRFPEVKPAREDGARQEPAHQNLAAQRPLVAARG